MRDRVEEEGGRTLLYYACWAALALLIWLGCHYSRHLQYSLLLFLFYGPQGLFVLVPLFPLGLALHRRHKSAAALALAATTMLWAAPGGCALSARGGGVGAETLEVTTVNADSWSTPLEDLRHYLKSCTSQVVFMQEVWTPETFRDCADSLPKLECYYQTGVSAPELAIGTSLPVKRLVTVSGAEDAAMALQVEWHDSPLLLCCVHLRKPDSLRLRLSLATEINRGHVAEIEKLVTFAAAEGMPLIMGGDFNSPPASPGQNLLRARLRDCFSQGGSGFGYTFPAACPLWRIDSLFISSPWSCSACKVGPNLGSDHRPVTATLGRWPQATGLER